MKIFFLILLTSAICASTEVEKVLSPNAVMRHLFEIFRNAIKHGSTENNTPILDPMLISKSEFNVENTNLRLTVNFTNSVYKGLGDFQIKQLLFFKEELAIDLILTFPKLIMESDEYVMAGNIYWLPLFGEGRLSFELLDCEIKSKIILKPSENRVSTLIEKFENPQFSIRQILSNTEYDGNIDCIINHIMKDVLAEYVTKFNRYIANAYCETIRLSVNVFLDRFDTWRIVSSLL